VKGEVFVFEHAIASEAVIARSLAQLGIEMFSKVGQQKDAAALALVEAVSGHGVE
jgi:hypothetical protein